MASCAKDSKFLCWTTDTEQPNGEIMLVIATTAQCNFNISWCPRNPAIIASTSVDGNVSIYSILVGVRQQVQTTSKIADSFPGMDQFAEAPTPILTAPDVSQDLKKPSKWLK
jgi:protein transport protein SEC31